MCVAWYFAKPTWPTWLMHFFNVLLAIGQAAGNMPKVNAAPYATQLENL